MSTTTEDDLRQECLARKRYDVYGNGPYVKYEDYEKLQKRILELEDQLQELGRSFDCGCGS